MVDDQYKLKGLITVKDIQKKLKYPNAAKDAQGRLRVGAAIGATGDFLERAQELVAKKVDVLAIDTAHGHSDAWWRRYAPSMKLPEVQLITGNVGTYEGACELISLGVDGIKVGIGPGSICTTRVVSGAGVPQMTAIAECSRATRPAGVPLIADGGIKYSGDITKAIAAGADCVMIGSLLAGTDESPGETILYQGRTFKTYRGMGSMGAMSQGSSDRYAQESSSKLVPEGIEGRVASKGPLSELVYQLVGGLKSGHGVLRRAEYPDAPGECPIPARFPGGPAGEPRPRRHHHQGSAELPGGVKLTPPDWRQRSWVSAATAAHREVRR